MDYYAGKLTDKRLKTAIKGSLPFYLNRLNTIEKLNTVYLSESISQKYEQCMLGLCENLNINNILNPKGLLIDPEIFNEYAILCEIEVKTDTYTKRLKIKAKLDNFTIDQESQRITLNDLKTTGKP